jgi:hypothetical protein
MYLQPTSAAIRNRPASDDYRPSKQVPFPLEIALAVSSVEISKSLGIGVARVLFEPLIKSKPVQRLVSVPIVE